MSAKRYPEQMWQAIRELWEVSPKLNFADAAKKVNELFGWEVPDSKVISNRAKRQGWIKAAQDLSKGTNRQLNDFIRKHHNAAKDEKRNREIAAANSEHGEADSEPNGEHGEVDGEIEKDSIDNSDTYQNKMVKSDSEGDKRRKFNHHNNNCRLVAATVIQKTRLNIARIGELISLGMESLEDVRNDLLDIDFNSADEKQLAIIDFKMNKISQMIDQTVKQSIALNNVARLEISFWGLEVNDLKDKTEIMEKRSAAVSDAEDKLAQSRKLMKEKQALVMARKVEILELAKQVEEGGE